MRIAKCLSFFDLNWESLNTNVIGNPLIAQPCTIRWHVQHGSAVVHFGNRVHGSSAEKVTWAALKGLINLPWHMHISYLEWPAHPKNGLRVLIRKVILRTCVRVLRMTACSNMGGFKRKIDKFD